MTFSLRKLIVVTVISDLITDYRVHKICQTLHDQGWRVLLIGTHKNKQSPLEARDYQTDRIKMWFRSSLWFYAEFNIRLFLRLLRSGGDIYLGNDLDTMPAMMLIARIKRKPLVYDSHEYFLEMAGLRDKPLRRSIWKRIEKKVFSWVNHIYTVSGSIRDRYQRTYLKSVLVVRNLPYKEQASSIFTREELERIENILRLIPEYKNILLYQGAGINADRGVEELVMSMQFLNPDLFHLIIVGGGDQYDYLKKLVDQYQLSEKITLIPKVPFSMLRLITRKAHLGFSIDKPVILNHFYSLPNKLFEYLHASVPVLASRLPEQEKIINQYLVGDFIDNHQPEHIAAKVNQIFADPGLLNQWKLNTRRVREELNWETESKIIIDIFKQVEEESVNH
jgi:glycosyltransferase involved in cell wall biosynthesis